MLQHMDKDLFEIFPDLPSLRGTRPAGRHIARQRFPMVNRRAEIPALRRLHHSDDVAFRRIREIAQAEYERLTPKGRLGRVLRTIIAVADAAMLAPANRRG